jgi:ABC-type amino acid transport substrate-binding protein
MKDKITGFILNRSSFKTPPLKNTGILQVCSYTSFAPMIYEDGKGFEADLLKAIAKLWDVHVQFHPEQNYDGIWLTPSAKDRNIDIAAGGITPKAHQENNCCFSIHTAAYTQSLLVRREDYDNGVIRDYSSFKNSNFKIGILGKSSGETYGYLRAKEANVSLDVFTKYESEHDLLKALKNKEIAAIARGSIGNDYQEKLNPAFITIARKSFEEMTAFSVDPNNPLLLVALNHAISSITEMGKISYPHWADNNHVFMNQVTKLLNI